jgi:hypothetical protein
LARKYGLYDYSQPAGGCCFLTDPQYAARLTDLWQHRPDRAYDLDDILLLKIGRHIRPRSHFKVIISRQLGEGRFLQGYRSRLLLLTTLSHPGPEALIDGSPSESDIELAARLVARYGQGRDCRSVTIQVEDLSGCRRQITVPPFDPLEIPRQWLL